MPANPYCMQLSKNQMNSILTRLYLYLANDTLHKHDQQAQAAVMMTSTNSSRVRNQYWTNGMERVK